MDGGGVGQVGGWRDEALRVIRGGVQAGRVWGIPACRVVPWDVTAASIAVLGLFLFVFA